MENDILKEVNAYRKKTGRSPLQMMDAASAQAAIHSRDMASGKTKFGHDGFESRITAIRKQATGTINAAAENVAYGELTAEKVVDGWLHSPGHKRNIEGDYNLTGIGVAKDKNGVIYFTQIFLRK
ncbi:CAP domain-containing protein [Filimonas effusa]|nr:CAP domain-containing protein [Filimonas effusa]